MKNHRSSTLVIPEKYCGRALSFAEAGAERDRRVFAVGIAAHAFLEAWGHATVKAGTLSPEAREEISNVIHEKLLSEGRSFDGVMEPPLSPGSVSSGRRVAEEWIEDDGHYLPEAAHYEIGVGFNEHWDLVPYSKSARYRVILDVEEHFEEEVDEEGYSSGDGYLARDYKSAWPAGRDLLDSLQIKGQLLALSKRHPKAAWVQAEIANLRTGAFYRTERIYLDEPEGQAYLEAAQRDITISMEAADRSVGADGLRPASPWAGCVGCPWVLKCEAGNRFIKSWTGKEDLTPLGMAQLLARTKAISAELEGLLKHVTVVEPVKTGDGIVGYAKKTRKFTQRAAPEVLWDRWTEGRDNDALDGARDTVLGFLKASKMGVSQVGNVIKAISGVARGPNKAEVMEVREELESDCLGSKGVPSFGVWKSQEG